MSKDDDNDKKKPDTKRKSPKRENPWAKSEKTPPKNTHDNITPFGPRGGNDTPDIEELLKKATSGVNDLLPSGFGPGRAVSLGLIALLALWLLSGLFFIQPSEHGVVLTFGKYSKTEENPGLKWRMPWPIQSHQIVNVTNERRINVGFRDLSGRGRSGKQDLADESLMLTGDENIIDIDFVVLWRIGDAKDFLYRIRDPEATIKIVAESAMREIIGRTEIQPALTEARSQIQIDTKLLMQAMLNEYEAGVQINNVQLQKVDPPAPVIDAFNDVQRARQEKEGLRNKAEAYRNGIIPIARGEANKLIQEAEAYEQEVVNRAAGDAARFLAIYNEYKNAKTVTVDRLHIEAMEKVIGEANTLILDGKGGGAVPYLSIDELTKKKKQ
ncbi:MAG: FtsH protease activity modulator HflK [Bdellovibrionales bacterium]